jgi:hypothetical protein
MFLATGRWASIPYRLSTKSAQELLLDVTMQIPGLLELADQIKLSWATENGTYNAPECTDVRNSHTARRNQAMLYLQDCDALKRKLNEWLENLRKSENEPLWCYSQTSDLRQEEFPSRPHLPLTPESEGVPLQSAMINFSSPRIPGLLIYFWTGLLELSAAALEIESLLRQDSVQNVANGIRTYSCTVSIDKDMPNELAQHICETAVHLNSSLEGCTMAYIPVKLAENHFARQVQSSGNARESQELERARSYLDYSREVLKTLQKWSSSF